MRRTFFSFKYDDVWRAMNVRNSWITKDRESRGFKDAAEFESVMQQSDAAIKRWINDQLANTSVTVVLVGANTDQSQWVQYEIDQSITRGNGLLGIDVSKIKDQSGHTTERCAKMPAGYDFYLWNKNDGRNNIGTWIEKAARDAGR